MGSTTPPTARKVAHAGLSTMLTVAIASAIGLWSSVGTVAGQDQVKSKSDEKKAPPAKVKLGLAINTPKALNGYTLLSTINSKNVYLLGNDGKVVHSWKFDTNSSHCCYLLPNGNLLRPADLGGREKAFGGGPAPLGRFQEFTWDGEVVWDFTYYNDKQLPHHDIHKMPNGNILMIVWEKKTVDECIAAGRKKELISKYVLPDAIIEVKPTGKTSGEVVWEWHLWDHLIQDHDATKANYGVVADHPELVDVNYVAPSTPPPAAPKDAAKKDVAKNDVEKKDVASASSEGPKDDPKAKKGKSKAEIDKLKSIGYAGSAASQQQRINPDWIHTNAVDYNAELDQIMMSSPELNEIWIIDHGTTTAEAKGHTGGRRGKGGDLLYRWGNPAVYKTGGKDDRKLFFQHNAHWIPKGLPGAGHVLVFNNRGGGGSSGPQSSAVDELVLPLAEDGTYTRENGKPFGPAEPIWRYTAPKKSDFYSSFISGTHRLPNGNTQICSGANGTIFEVTPEKEIVWKYVNPAKGGIGGGGGPPPPHQVLNGFLQDALSLTSDQKKTVEALQKDVDATIEKTLDADQKKKLAQPNRGFGSITLPGQLLSTSTVVQLKPTDDQKKALAELQKSVDDKLASLLTDDQKKQFQKMKDDFTRGGPPGGGPGGPPGGPGGGPGGPPPGLFNGPQGGASLFRAYKYAADYPAFAGRELKPGLTVEEMEKPKPEPKDKEAANN